jgi:hypothetical protein
MVQIKSLHVCTKKLICICSFLLFTRDINQIYISLFLIYTAASPVNDIILDNSISLFVWLVADGWCWFVLREKYFRLVAGGWFVLR